MSMGPSPGLVVEKDREALALQKRDINVKPVQACNTARCTQFNEVVAPATGLWSNLGHSFLICRKSQVISTCDYLRLMHIRSKVLIIKMELNKCVSILRNTTPYFILLPPVNSSNVTFWELGDLRQITI